MKDQGETHSAGSRPGKGGSIFPWHPIKSPKQTEEGHSGIMKPLGETLPQGAEHPPGRGRAKGER